MTFEKPLPLYHKGDLVRFIEFHPKMNHPTRHRVYKDADILTIKGIHHRFKEYGYLYTFEEINSNFGLFEVELVGVKTKDIEDWL